MQANGINPCFSSNTLELKVIGVDNWSSRRDKSRLYNLVLGLSGLYWFLISITLLLRSRA
ncbi:MAG: hypothetical protein RM022_012125 [Nostoc sp. EfeVER01]|uniref:hypothetical protein n=1 Tax=Nostoc sp. EfeVER01 TaxID=3075406 RepID=UPI002AD3CAE0|nr:hypothetical protein [Nostoc sp. EfeVER01]MDZ7945610.1 hypothetical protein [Nostoc sp. EfeVER01]